MWDKSSNIGTEDLMSMGATRISSAVCKERTWTKMADASEQEEEAGTEQQMPSL